MINFKEIKYSGHSLTRMFERGIEPELVEKALKEGEIIEEYPQDTPYCSFLLLNILNGKPLHVVASIDVEKEIAFVITVYYPDPAVWENNFKTRKKK